MLVSVIFRQIIIMALLVGVGMLLTKKGYLTEQGTKEIGALLLRVVIPCLIVKSYITEYSAQKLRDLLLSAGLALIGFAVSMSIACLVYGTKRKIENVAAAFCNAGFVGIPLVQATIGEEGVFFVAASVAFLNLFQWTYGLLIMTGSKDTISPRTVAKNPVLIGIILGISLFLLRVPVPEIVVKTLGYIAGMNTPIAMILIGSYMAKLRPRELLDRRAYGCVLFRLLIIPAVILLIFTLLPVRNSAISMAVFLAAITPVGANNCVFAKQYDCDYKLSVITVCLSTLFSVVTIPLMAALAERFL